MNNYTFANDDRDQCSSGCESGWTSYLQHSSSSSPYVISCNHNINNQENDYRRRRRNNGGFTEAKRLKEDDDVDEEEDEDLSMVSDASSGPPHYGDNGVNGCFYKYAAIDDVTLSRNILSRKKNRENNRRRIKPGQDQSSSLLDDTASSPFFDFSDKTFSQPPVAEKVLEYSQGYSSTVQFEVRPPYQEHYDFFQSPQYSGNHLQQNQWFEG